MSMPSLFQRPPTALALTVLTLGCLLGLYGYEFFRPTIQIDDAYISYRYAQNLVDGHGLVYNVGERVEGYTNLLWTLMVAGGIALGVSASLVGHWLGFASGVFLLLATYLYSRSLLPNEMKWLALAAPFLLYASNSFAAWTISGLETPLFAAWVTAAVTAFAVRRMGWVLGFCILASLTRPEGALLAPALVALRCKAYRIGFAFLALIAIYLIAVGGDVFFNGRFLLPVLPILIAGALVGVATVGKASTKAGLLAALALPAFVLCSLYSLWPRNTDFPATLEVGQALPLSAKRESVKVPTLPFTEDFFKAQVAKLRQLDPPVKLVAAIGIGELGFFGAEMAILDLVGLTDRHIAKSDEQVDGAMMFPGHQKSDAGYVLSRRPDVIYIQKLGEVAFLPTVVSLHREPRLLQEYLWDEQLQAYVRRAELRRLP